MPYSANHPHGTLLTTTPCKGKRIEWNRTHSCPHTLKYFLVHIYTRAYRDNTLKVYKTRNSRANLYHHPNNILYVH